jgi:hypothetical protein
MPGFPLPEGYHSVNPYIVVDDAERLIAFLVVVCEGREQGTRELKPRGTRRSQATQLLTSG